MSRRKTKKNAPPPTSEPWISPRNGLIGMIAVSLALAIWTTWQIHAFKPWLDSILWGLGFGIALWFVFGLVYSFTRWARKKIVSP